ncbi:putative oxoglutarate/iron-dependent dioxygenase, isopenicillin N synthase [Helianthus annuus]|nr:putative oxoglutarate/iron-dependent dioxygenase, isopenicillin N synthase [Helianthus annuus]
MVQKLLQALINNLGVKVGDSRFHELTGFNTVNLNFYPPCPNPELTVGIGRHSDAGMLTVLLQDNIGGLYVRKAEPDHASPGNELWVEIPPVHGALVINVGDSLQVYINFHPHNYLPEAVSLLLRGRGKTVYILPSSDPTLTLLLLLIGFIKYDDDDRLICKTY